MTIRDLACWAFGIVIVCLASFEWGVHVTRDRNFTEGQTYGYAKCVAEEDNDRPVYASGAK